MTDIEILLAAVFDETEAKAEAVAPEAEAAKERARLGRRGPRGNSKRARVARAMLSEHGVTDEEVAVIYGKRRSMLTAAKKLAEVYDARLEVTGKQNRRYRLVRDSMVAVAEAA